MSPSVPVLGKDKKDQRPEEKQDGGLQAKRLQSYSNRHIRALVWELGPEGALRLGFIKGGQCPLRLGSHQKVAGPCALTIVSVSGPAEVLEPSAAQLEGGLVAFPQGSAVPQRQGGVLRTPVGDEAVLLASVGRGQGERVTGPAWFTLSDHPSLQEEQKATRIQ